MDALFEAMGLYRVKDSCSDCECGEDCEEPEELDEVVDRMEEKMDQLRHDLEVVQVKIKRLENWTSYEDEKEQ